jgi:hypothetical protein
MSFEKEAAEAVNMLMAEGIDFDSATDLVMEKVAGAAYDIAFKGYSNAEREVARQYGQEGPAEGWFNDSKNNALPHMAAIAGGVGGGLAGSMLGLHVGSKFNRPGLGLLAGYAGGAVAGMTPILRHQAERLHEKYREKQAAVNMLVEEGLDFDSAVDLVMEKSAFLLGAATGALSSRDGHRWGGAGVGALASLPGAAVGHHLGGGIVGNIGGQLAAAAVAGHLYGEKHREKQAAVNMLVEEGLDFDSAVSLVDHKASELYGD